MISRCFSCRHAVLKQRPRLPTSHFPHWPSDWSGITIRAGQCIVANVPHQSGLFPMSHITHNGAAYKMLGRLVDTGLVWAYCSILAASPDTLHFQGVVAALPTSTRHCGSIYGMIRRLTLPLYAPRQGAVAPALQSEHIRHNSHTHKRAQEHSKSDWVAFGAQSGAPQRPFGYQQPIRQ